MDKSTLIGRHIHPKERQKPMNLSPLQGSTRNTTRDLDLNHNSDEKLQILLNQGQGAISISQRSMTKTTASVTRKNLRIKISLLVPKKYAPQAVEQIHKWDRALIYRPYCSPRGPPGSEREAPAGITGKLCHKYE